MKFNNSNKTWKHIIQNDDMHNVNHTQLKSTQNDYMHYVNPTLLNTEFSILRLLYNSNFHLEMETLATPIQRHNNQNVVNKQCISKSIPVKLTIYQMS